MNIDKNGNDEGYVGNVFGWRTSLWSLALILGLLALMLCRYWYLKANDQWPKEVDQPKIELNNED